MEAKKNKFIPAEEIEKIIEFAEKNGLMRVPIDKVFKKYAAYKAKQERNKISKILD